jgi:hypothetical protein
MQKLIKQTFIFRLICSFVHVKLDKENNNSEHKEMAMTEQEAMEIWMKMATPGPEHKMLAGHVGKWKAAIKTWMAPAQPANESTGTATITMLFDGRIKHEDFHAEMGGMSFDGFGMIGYDNFTRKFWMTWADNMSTSLMYCDGTLSSDGKTLTFTGKINKPVQNLRDVGMKCAYKFLSDNHHVFEAWEQTGTPQEFKTLEIDYTR